MGKKPDGTEHSRKICLLESISVPHPISSRPTPSPSRLPPPLSQFTHFSNAKHASRRCNTVQNYHLPPFLRSFAPYPPVLPPSPYPLQWLKNSPFPKPASALSRLSYTPECSFKGPPRSSISAICFLTASQFPLLARTWMAFGWK